MRFRPHLAAILLLASSQAAAVALPQTAGELRQILERVSGGDAEAYAASHAGALRRMACEGRADLIGVLRASGLDPDELDTALHASAVSCSLRNGRTQALDLLLTPAILARMEEATRAYPQDRPPLRLAAEGDDQGVLGVLLANGASLWETHEPLRSALSREGHLLMAARHAHHHQLQGLMAALSGAGFGDLLADASLPGFADHVAWTALAQAGHAGPPDILTFVTLPGPGQPTVPVLIDLVPGAASDPHTVSQPPAPASWPDQQRYLAAPAALDAGP